MTCQYICHFTAEKVNRLRKIKIQLKMETDLHNSENKRLTKINNYNWGMADKCKFGISCNKVSQAERDFRTLTSEIDELMTLYIENKNYDRYHTILNLLRGYFPTVYSQFERDILKNK